jgi:glutamate-1-semialdehyde aminotransferase
MKIDKSLELWERGVKLIPRGTQTMSKAPDQYVFGVHPIYLESGQGCMVKDVDGNKYIDYPCSLGPIILGHNHERTVSAVTRQIKKGITFSLMHGLEVELAELLVDVIPCAEQVKFGKNGSDATAMAVRAARSYTGKEHILVPEGHYHGWHSFFAAAVRPYGVPNCLKELVEFFQYNDLVSLENKLMTKKFAAVIMEPIVTESPNPGFLKGVRDLCTKYNAILIFDEVITGFRWALGGAQEYYNVIPDLTAAGKAMANGMPISVIAGKEFVMREFDHVFFSSTFGGELCSIAAAIATVGEMKEKEAEIYGHIWKYGQELQSSFNNHANDIGVPVTMIGCSPRQNLRFRRSIRT